MHIPVAVNGTPSIISRVHTCMNTISISPSSLGSQKDEALPSSSLPANHHPISPTVLVCKESASEDVENALDNLVDQLQNSCSLTRNYYLKMIAFLKSRDLSERLEATHVFRKSLSEKSSNRHTGNSRTSKEDISDTVALIRHRKGSGIQGNGNISNGRSSNNYSATPLSSGTSSSSPYNNPSPQHTDTFSAFNETPTVDVSIQDLIDEKVVPYIVNSLCRSSHIHLMFESVLLLAKLVSGTKDQTRAVVAQTGLIKELIHLLKDYKHNCPVEFRNTVFTVLRNVAIDGEEFRDMILQTPEAVNIIVENARLSIDSIALRVCFVIAFAHRPPPFNEISSILEFFADCIRESDDPQILSIACQGLVSMCDNASNVENMINLNILADVIRLMRHTNSVIIFDALSVIAKVAFGGSNSQIHMLVNHDTVSVLVQILTNPTISQSATRSRACNVLGNIGCETPREVQAVIDTNVFPLLLNIFRYDPDYNTRVEAAYAVCASASRADCVQVGYIVSCTSRGWGDEIASENSCMQLIADMLELVRESDPTDSSNLKLCRAILRGLDNILNRGCEEGKKHGLWENPYAFLFKSVQGHSKLAQMQFFPEYTVVSKTNEILEKYFYVTSGFSIHN